MGLSVFPEATAASPLPRAVNVFTSTGTYTVPAGATWAHITAVGGGGSGGATNATSRACAGGGSGSFIETWVAVTAGATHTVTIGAAGAARAADAPSANGNAGGTTSVGTLVTNVYGGGGGISRAGFAPGGIGERPGEVGPVYYNGAVVYNVGAGASGFFGGVQAGAGSTTGGNGYGSGGGGGEINVTSGAGTAGYVRIVSY